MTVQNELENEQVYPEVAEAPRYSCSLGGAYSTALAIYGTVPILHAGAGCGLGQLFGQHYPSGQNTGGQFGTTSTPCSCLIEEHVIFGGENKLRDLIASSQELLKGDLFAVISGCVPSLIGDDVEAVVSEFRDKAPIINVKTAGFAGNSYTGYEQFFEAIIDQLLVAQPTEKGLINIFGIVPNQNIFYKGDLATIRQTLEKLGLKVNIIFTEEQGLENLKKISAAELSIVLSTWNGHKIVNKLQEKFNIPYAAFPSVPVGPKQTSHFLRQVGERLGIDRGKVETVIAAEEKKAYRSTEYLGDILFAGLPHTYYAVVADSNTAVGVTKYLSNEIGYLAEVVIISDNPPEEVRGDIIKELTDGLESVLKPEIIFEIDAYKIREKLKGRSFLALFASSLEKYIAGEEFGALHLSVSFPALDRLVIDRSYAGFRGGLALMEDLVSKFAGPL